MKPAHSALAAALLLPSASASASALSLSLSLSLLGCGASSGEKPIVVPPRASYDSWTLVQPEGAVCGNGSPYKFFVNYSATSNNVVIAFEPGGACWDYESCTGQGGIRGAANVNGLDDDHYGLAPFIVPYFQRELPENPADDWNYVYVPYCTGDVHTGNAVKTYADPTGQNPDIEFHHRGYDNVQKVIAWMAGEFQSVPKLLVTGCSAGGVGALANYHFLREGLPGVERAYLLSDSGPIFPASIYSRPLHDKVRESWNLDSVLSSLPSVLATDDFGTINTALSDLYPDDRLAVTFFRRDYNFSIYSYERFYDFPPKEEIMEMWWDDTQRLVTQFDMRDNLAYYIPYWRRLNDSHCTTVITFAGSDIEEADMDLGQFSADLVDDSVPLTSYLESAQADEDLE